MIRGKNNKYKKIYKNKKIILRAMAAAVIIGSMFASLKFFKVKEEKIYTDSDQNSVELENEKDEEKSNLGNGGYTSLEDDPNAEDAMKVYEVTDKLLKNEIKYPVRTDGKKVVYLTFDDGPSTTNTPAVLDILKQNNIKATFMIQGSNAERNEESKEILRETVREGHAIGNHTYSHDYKYLYPNNTISPTNFMNDIDKCNNALKDILGQDFNTRVIRFPGGYWSWKGREQIKPILNEKGYASINWNALSEDAEGKKNKSAQELIDISRQTLDSLGKDADSVVFLMHDTYDKEETVKALQGIIDLFKERGFEFKTLK